MTPQQGKGVQALFRLTMDTAGRMPRAEAKGLVSAMSSDELADFMDASSAAGVAAGSGGNLFYEEGADRIRRGEAVRMIAEAAIDKLPRHQRAGFRKALLALSKGGRP
jgi:hypothetical protein